MNLPDTEKPIAEDVEIVRLIMRLASTATTLSQVTAM